VPAGLLEVEITESAMMGDQAEILAELAAIRALGVKLHVDDFGTGYSSLSQLQRMKMDVLKVDRSFTAELGRSKEGTVFFQAIVSMAHALGMEVVAEGVENEDQLMILRALNCNEVQGYFVARPQPAASIAPLLAKRYLFKEALAA
jgi:EAL domain-containing protein (putative c-di-GMP-specific phosphodiesterase class I)